MMSPGATFIIVEETIDAQSYVCMVFLLYTMSRSCIVVWNVESLQFKIGNLLAWKLLINCFGSEIPDFACVA